MVGETNAPKHLILRASGGGNMIGRAAFAGKNSLAVMLLSVCSKPGGSSSLFLGDDSLIGSGGHSELDHL